MYFTMNVFIYLLCVCWFMHVLDTYSPFAHQHYILWWLAQQWADNIVALLWVQLSIKSRCCSHIYAWSNRFKCAWFHHNHLHFVCLKIQCIGGIIVCLLIGRLSSSKPINSTHLCFSVFSSSHKRTHTFQIQVKTVSLKLGNCS